MDVKHLPSPQWKPVQLPKGNLFKKINSKKTAAPSSAPPVKTPETEERENTDRTPNQSDEINVSQALHIHNPNSVVKVVCPVASAQNCGAHCYHDIIICFPAGFNKAELIRSSSSSVNGFIRSLTTAATH
jgi:hypothetical protein